MNSMNSMNRIPKPASEESYDDEPGLELPVDPDEGSALIPDEERVINVPS